MSEEPKDGSGNVNVYNGARRRWSRKKIAIVAAIIIAIIILIVVLCVIFVAVPKMIQDQVNNSLLTVQEVSATQTLATTLLFGVNSTVMTNSSTKATIDSFNASLSLTDKVPSVPFVYITMPQLHTQKVSTINISQELTIYDEQAFADYNSWYLLNDSFRVTVSGETHVHVKGLPSYKIHFQKTVNLTGLNSFANLNITSSAVSFLADSQGDDFHGFLNIPNPSGLTFDVGNASFINMFNGTQIGTSNIDNLFLVPGNNNVSIRANVSQGDILSDVLSQPYCNTGILPISFVGTTIFNNGSELAYFEQAFRSNVLTLDLNIAADLAPLGINVTCSNTTAA